MSQNPPDPTVGLLHSGERLTNWSTGAGLRSTCDLLLSALRQETAPADYLGTVLARIRRSADLLRTWAAAGEELYGLARLASALEADPGVIEVLGAGTRAVARDALKDFRGSSETHYLYVACVARDPVSKGSKGWFDALRMWLLVHGLERAARDKPVVCDGRLAEACTRLRRACEETAFLEWLPLFERLKMRTDSWRLLNLHFDGAAGRYGPDLDAGNKTDMQRAFLRLLGRVARKEISETEPAQPECSVFKRTDVCDTDDEEWTDLAATGTDTELRLKELPTLEGEDEQSVEGDADPESAIDVQERTAWYIQLLSGASARFLPWDWPTLAPPELVRLRQLIECELQSSSAETRLLASIVWLAMATNRSLEMASRFEIGLESNIEWRVAIRERRVHRSPPRRTGHWRPNDEQLQRIRPASDRLGMTIPSPVGAVLAERLDAAQAARSIAELWRGTSARPLLESFRAWTEADLALSRVTQGMLAGNQARALYADRGDHVAARLLVASPSAGLPAACAYTPYTLTDLPRVDGLEWDVAGETNVGGSLLDPEDDFLKRGFADAHDRLCKLAHAADPLTFHNSLTAYWDAALRAATGIRPFAGRWTRRDDIDVDFEFLVVNDKPSPRESRVRLVPVVRGLLAQFSDSYVMRHTEALRQWLASQGLDVSELPDAQALACRSSTGPMLFNLEFDAGQLVIHPAAHKIDAAACSPESPLPANVYRHRLRTWLHRCGSDPEVIDSVLGHQDGATLTHGDHSMRTWLVDADALREDIAAAYTALDIKPPPAFAGWTEATLSVGAAAVRSPEMLRAVAENVVIRISWLTRMRAARSAKLCIEVSLATPTDTGPWTQTQLVERLSRVDTPAKVERIGKQLMRTPKGVPSTHGPLHYAYFLRLIERVWEFHGKRVPMRRRYYDRPEDRSAFTQHAAGALARRSELRTVFEETFRGLSLSKLTAEQAVWIAVSDLALYSAVADPLLIESIRASVQFRVVRYGDANWLEWNASGQVLRVDEPIQRIRVTRRCAHALLRVLATQRNRVQRDSAPPGQLTAFVQALRLRSSPSIATFGQAVFQLTSLINQCNAIELPGSVGAFLSGRTRSTSLHWGEWLSVRHGTDRTTAGWTVVEVPLQQRDTAAKQNKETPSRQADPCRALLRLQRSIKEEMPGRDRVGDISASWGRDLDRSGLIQQQAARKFFQSIRRILAKPARLEATPNGRNGKLPPAYRRTMQRKIEALVREEGGNVSSAVAALGSWCASLFEREGERDLLRESSIERYLGALSPRFVSCASGANLAALDAEEIEAMYCAFLETAGKTRVGYIYRRLREFHHYAESKLSLPAIDWSELVPEESHALSSPGHISERDYRRILLTLERSTEMREVYRQAGVALVILGYRFGLRGSEALGLRNCDLRQDGDSRWVVVEGNRFRALKTQAGRRLVPVTERWHPYEAAALDRLMRQSLVGGTGLRDVGLFCDLDAPDRLLDWELLRRDVNAAIKHATQRPHLTLHHLRHSYASRLWTQLELAHRKNIDWIPSAWICSAAESKRCLLGPGPSRPDSRRTPWALARALGHAHPRTTQFSYVHLLSDAAECVAFAANPDDWTAPPLAAIDLSALACRTRPVRIDRTTTQQSQLKLVAVVGMLSHLDAGISYQQLPALWPISAGLAAQLAGLLQHIERVLGINVDSPEAKGDIPMRKTRYAKLASGGLMAHVMGARFQTLYESLGALYTDEARRRFASIRLTGAQFGGMFGSRRNISMYFKPQFALVRLVIELLGVEHARLRLGAPDDLSAPMRQAAEATGWLAPRLETLPGADSFNLSLNSRVQLDEVRFGIAEMPVPQRVVLSLERDDKAKMRTRWDLILALVVTIPLLTFNPED